MRHAYIEKTAEMQNTSYVSDCCLIGMRSSVGNNSKIINSTIGSDCEIGDNVIIENSIICNDV